MINFAALGNDLYTGKRSVDFVGRYKRWYALSGVFVLIAVLGLVWHGPQPRPRVPRRLGVPGRPARRPASDYEAQAKDAVGAIADARARPR